MAVRAAALAGGVGSSVLEVVERLGDLQLDPTRAVERSHLLVLWSRLGAFGPCRARPAALDERRLFEHRAFIYRCATWPCTRRMRAFPSPETLRPTRARKVAEWLTANVEFERYVLAELRRRGALLSETSRIARAAPGAGGWNGKNLSQMLEFLWGRGEVLVAGREGGERVDLAERCCPSSLRRSARTVGGTARQGC